MSLYVSRVHNVSANLWLQDTVHAMILPVISVFCFYIITFQRMCTVPNMTFFISSLMSCFTGMLLRYFENDFDVVPFAHTDIGITFVITLHMRCFSVGVSLYIKIIIINSFFSFPTGK